MIDPNELLGQDLGGYRVTGFLGAGASAWVYRAESAFDPGIVRALKVVHPSLTREAEFQHRFAEEARNLDRLRHPGIVRFYGVRSVPFRDDVLLVMELEFLDGHTLRQYATRTDPTAVPLRRAVRWVREAAEAIGVAHQIGVVHRDLKPDNLQLLSTGQIKVLDFGLARAVDDAARTRAITMMGTVPGTPAYMAPELCRGGLPTGASDVYGLGIILFELVTGRHPFAESDGSLPEGTHMALAQIDRPAPPVTSLRPDVPPALGAIIASVLSKRPSDRPADAAQLAGALRGVEPMLTAQASTSLLVSAVSAGSAPTPMALPVTTRPSAEQTPVVDQGSLEQSVSVNPTTFRLPSFPTGALHVAEKVPAPTSSWRLVIMLCVAALVIVLLVLAYQKAFPRTPRHSRWRVTVDTFAFHEMPDVRGVLFKVFPLGSHQHPEQSGLYTLSPPQGGPYGLVSMNVQPNWTLQQFYSGSDLSDGLLVEAWTRLNMPACADRIRLDASREPRAPQTVQARCPIGTINLTFHPVQ